MPTPERKTCDNCGWGKDGSCFEPEYVAAINPVVITCKNYSKWKPSEGESEHTAPIECRDIRRNELCPFADYPTTIVRLEAELKEARHTLGNALDREKDTILPVGKLEARIVELQQALGEAMGAIEWRKSKTEIPVKWATWEKLRGEG